MGPGSCLIVCGLTLPHDDLTTANAKEVQENFTQASRLASNHSPLLQPIMNFIFMQALFEDRVCLFTYTLNAEFVQGQEVIEEIRWYCF